MSALLLDLCVSDIRQLTPDIREYSLRQASGDALPSWESGAHIEVHLQLPSGPVLRHYSLIDDGTAPSNQRSCWRIAVQRKARPRASTYIHSYFAVGTSVQASMPKNHFRLDWRDRKSLLIAGGIGITPLMGMAHSLARRGRGVELVYLGRERAAMAYADNLANRLQSWAHIYCAQEHGAKRMDLLQLLRAQPAHTGIYVCGPASLISGVYSAAQELGIDPIFVHSEAFSPPSDGTETAFDLELTQSGRMLRVGQHTSILEAMQAAGLHPLYDCARGQCGLCALGVRCANGDIQHRDNYLTAPEKAANTTMCICVSRLKGSRLVLEA